MATEVSPIYFPADKLPRVASADITAGQIAVVSGDDTVAPSAAASSAWLGVAATSAKAGEQVVVVSEGVWELAASGAISAGARVISAANGAVATIGAETDYSRVVGTALRAAASGKVIVKIAG